MTTTNETPVSPLSPPPFEAARNPRQKARAAGLHPDYWYPVEYSDRLRKGQVLDVTFWKRSFALYRDENGRAHALENRCAHRQLKLSLGEVKGCKLTCPYHGWSYDQTGKVVEIPHELYGRPMPHFRVPSFGVQERYGLIWIFPGDQHLAAQRVIPEIPEIEGRMGEPWACVPVDWTWRCHHSMIIDNVLDFSHAYLHRKYQPFTDAKLRRYEEKGDCVEVEYDTTVGGGRISGLFVDRKGVNTNHMRLGYSYPYQYSSTDDKIKHWCFILPIDERHSRAFFLFYFDALKVPFTDLRIPQRVLGTFMRVANRVLIRPLINQDGWALEAEQRAYDTHYNAPIAELNPAVSMFQQLTIRKWEEHLSAQRSRSMVKPCAKEAATESAAVAGEAAS